jgi:hypothetical protein
MKKISDITFELDRIYNSFADQILVADSVSKLLYDSGNMVSTGQEIERSLRTILQSLLPDRLNIAQGHIIDAQMSLSRQQDILIANGDNSKAVLKTLDGTEFLMYETIFAIGEVKKSLSEKALLSTIESKKDVVNRLSRAPIGPKVFASSPNIITTNQDLTNYPIRNPLFTFLFSIDYDSTLKLDKIRSILSDRDNWPFLPNCFVVLKRGIFIVVDSSVTEEISIKLYPQFESQNLNCSWYFLPFEEMQKGRSLAYLLFLLKQHIDDSLLEQPSILSYASDLLEINPRTLTSLNKI